MYKYREIAYINMHIEERNRNSNIEMHIEIEYRKIYKSALFKNIAPTRSNINSPQMFP